MLFNNEIMKKYLILFLFLIPVFTSAQVGKVEIIQDPKIDQLVEKRIAVSKTQTTIRGYRIQVFQGEQRTEAYNRQALINTQYKELPTYVTYQAPDFRLRVGDFKTLKEAQRYQQAMLKLFDSAFIVEENINPVKLP